MKTRLCQQFVTSGGDHNACPFFAKHGWCRFAHGDHELHTPALPPNNAVTSRSLAPFAHHARQWSASVEGKRKLDAPNGSVLKAARIEHDLSAKLEKPRMKTRLCQQFINSGRDNQACPHFARHGWCAYAHGEHELEDKQTAVPSTLQNDEVEQIVSAKLNAARLKSRICQQYLDSGGHDDACPHFVRHGWCAYAHGEHELEDHSQAATEMLEPVELVTHEVDFKVSPKLAHGRLKTRLCQQFVDGGCVDSACVHFARHGWCAYAHGEHEIEEPTRASSSQAAPYPEDFPESQLGHGVSAKLNSSRLKTRLCQQFVNSGGRDDACPHFVRHGWCAYAHGDDELGQVSSEGLEETQDAYVEAPPLISAKLDSSRMKTRLCQQFLDGGRVDSACLHFARHGWCAYAHGEHEMLGGETFHETPVHSQLQPSYEVSAKLDSKRMKTRMCQQFINSDGDHNACPHFVRHGWCAYAHGEHELDKAMLSSPSSQQPNVFFYQQPPPLVAPQVSTKLDPARRKTRLSYSVRPDDVNMNQIGVDY